MSHDKFLFYHLAVFLTNRKVNTIRQIANMELYSVTVTYGFRAYQPAAEIQHRKIPIAGVWKLEIQILIRGIRVND